MGITKRFDSISPRASTQVVKQRQVLDAYKGLLGSLQGYQPPIQAGSRLSIVQAVHIAEGLLQVQAECLVC